ncbi:MAG: hypothetical protein DHS20C18_54300 [Saprospiraceae bacterium]|nr:MAG: hypothetical protein DHS20C18_54300 [Saprospiraceae bacterium]
MEKDHYQLTNAEFEQRFEAATLDPSLFSHEAHLRLAWIHVTQYGVEQAEENICTQILNFVKHLGAEDKFNKTLTIAAVKAVHHFIQKSKANNFSSFIQEFPRLKTNFKDLLDFHYGFDIFHSERAKKEYLEPDLLPFE